MNLSPVTSTVGTPKEFLRHQHGVEYGRGITIDADTVAADPDGKKILLGGTAMGKITASGLFGPYDAAAVDGREVGVGLLAGDVDCTDGDQPASVLQHCFAIEANCAGVDAGFKTDCPLIHFS